MIIVIKFIHEKWRNNQIVFVSFLKWSIDWKNKEYQHYFVSLLNHETLDLFISALKALYFYVGFNALYNVI